MPNAKAYSAASATSNPRFRDDSAPRDPGDHDVQIEILFCGVCHSDLHQAAQRVEQRDAHGLSLRSGT